MSKYNEYAKRLDKAFNDAAEVQREALAEYQRAEQAVHAAETPLERAEAKDRKDKAKEALDAVKRETWPEFRKTRDQIGRELQAAVDKAETANPDEVDQNAVNLLYSDMLTRNDLKGMADKYSDNKTMLRMIGSKAEALAEQTNDRNARRELNQLSRACSKGSGDNTMKNWENLCEVSAHYSGETKQTNDPNYVCAINAHWRDANIQSAIDDF